MKTTLVEATEKLSVSPAFWAFVTDILLDEDAEDYTLKEGCVVEIKSGHIVVSFTWDMITVVNCRSNKYIDCHDIVRYSDILKFIAGEK